MNTIHDFLIQDGVGLNRAALEMKHLRAHIESLPKTAATFRLRDVDGITGQVFEDVHVEFAGAWPLHESYGSTSRGPRYVNPNYYHAHQFSDLIVECGCGALIVQNYDYEDSPFDNDHNHTEACLPFDRLRARADMNELRYHEMYRLGWLGWRGNNMAPRFGVTSNSMGSTAREFETTMQEVYDRYRLAASNTYKLLVNEYGVPHQEVAECYGHAVPTMTRWAKKYTDYESEVGINQHTLTEDGQFRFVRNGKSGEFKLMRQPTPMKGISVSFDEDEIDDETAEFLEESTAEHTAREPDKTQNPVEK